MAEIHAEDIIQDQPPQVDGEPEGCRPPLWLILVALGLLVLASITGVYVFNALYGLVFQPEAPRPRALVELAHEEIARGVDRWQYEVPLNPCEVVQFYEARGSTCTVSEGVCAGERYTAPVYEIDAVATCTGVQPFSIYALRWVVTVDPIYAPDPVSSTFSLFSEVLWGGPPRATATPAAE
ncbi:MAG: hypothetical protein ACOCXZ_01290 [Chloroflexota bacterium]